MSKLLVVILLLSIQVQAQDTTRAPQSSASVMDISGDKFQSGFIDSSYVQPPPVLPHTMLFTQRIFWGPSGLLRVAGVAPLTAEGRKKEVKVRHLMLIAHQVTGYVTLAGFVMQGILGAKMNKATGNDYSRLHEAQQTTAAITNIAYGTTALLSLTAPPKLMADRKKASGIKLHKYLSIIHLTGFVATTVLARKMDQNSELRPYQQIATFTTFAAFAPALIALKF